MLLSIFQTPELSDDQPILEAVTSLDQLLQLLYPEYSLLQHCLRKKSWRLSSVFPSFPDSSASAFHSTDDDLWGQPREEPLYKMDGTLGGKWRQVSHMVCTVRNHWFEYFRIRTPAQCINRTRPLSQSYEKCLSTSSHWPSETFFP